MFSTCRHRQWHPVPKVLYNFGEVFCEHPIADRYSLMMEREGESILRNTYKRDGRTAEGKAFQGCLELPEDWQVQKHTICTKVWSSYKINAFNMKDLSIVWGINDSDPLEKVVLSVCAKSTCVMNTFNVVSNAVLMFSYDASKNNRIYAVY